MKVILGVIILTILFIGMFSLLIKAFGIREVLIATGFMVTVSLLGALGMYLITH